MITETQARNLVGKFLLEHVHLIDDMPAIVDSATIKKEYGWIFFYNSKRYIDTGEFLYALAGNGPVVVEKSDGRIVQLGTSLSVDAEISQYEQSR